MSPRFLSPKDKLSKLIERMNRAKGHKQFSKALNAITGYLNLQNRRRSHTSTMCAASR